MKRLTMLIAFAVAIAPLKADLSRDQKLLDFQNMAAIYAKRYAPYEWKKQAFGFDLFNITAWLERVAKSKDDLEFYEICAEYVASFQDTHSQFVAGSSFVADLGFSVDIYDGKLLIEAIDRSRLPLARYPFQAGDELVTLDGKDLEQWLADFGRFRKWGNPATTRRSNADLITFRVQSTVPRAVELGDAATAMIRRAGGDIETFTIPWTKTGVPLKTVGPVPMPKRSASKAIAAEEEEAPQYLRPWLELHNYSAPTDLHLMQGEAYNEETGQRGPRRYLLGIGSPAPVFQLPSSFQQRLGRTPADFLYTGIYESGGYRIGFIRVRSFPGILTPALQRELDTEIPYLQQNTDGLVVDVMRNPGGGCYMRDLASYLTPNNFYFFGEYVRPTLDRINSFQSALEMAKRQNGGWIVDLYTMYLDHLKQAYSENRGLTGSIPACSLNFENEPAKDSAGRNIAYTKPLIILIDDFSISAADIFPSMMQDNKRGLLVGTRTSGGGGSVSGWRLIYSEALATNTNTLVIRKTPIVTADLPTAPYVENIGARPDIELSYMTRDNLMNRGRPFVDAFTKIIVDQIAAAGK